MLVVRWVESGFILDEGEISKGERVCDGVFGIWGFDFFLLLSFVSRSSLPVFSFLSLLRCAVFHFLEKKSLCENLFAMESACFMLGSKDF